MARTLRRAALTLLLFSAAAGHAQALEEQLCDPQFEDCRAPILNLIRNEQVRIDVAFWYMTDSRYSNELVKRFQAGIPVRVLVDPQANNGHPYNNTILQQLKNAGIPMRYRKSGGILHWKMMLFDGQDVVHFSKANFDAPSYVYQTANVDYFDEAIYFSGDDALTNTFRTKFDNLWTNTSSFANYANVTTPTRAYGSGWSAVPWMNMPPGQDFATRAINRYNAEQQQIDVLVYRATDDRHADAMIAAVNRGVRVRLITEPQQYRDPEKLRHSYNIDRMYMAGVEIKHRNHTGFLHEALVVMRGLGEVIFGSSNWSPASSNKQWEHNLFYTPSLNKRLDGSGETIYDWFAAQFDRKWNNTNAPNAYVPFQPLPPTAPTYSAPANGSAAVPLSATLTWDGGFWAYKYDIYFGVTSTPPLYQSDLVLGSPDPGQLETYTINNLSPGTTYYWRIVGKTMADTPTAPKAASGPTWSFTTAAGGGGNASDVVLYAGKATTKAGTWEIVNDATAAGGVRMHQPDRGAGKVNTPAANPSNYFSMSFNADAGIPYHVWIRGRADNNSFNNDSVWVQFNRSVDNTGTPVWRIGSADGAPISIQDCSGCPIQNWGWNDNGWASLGPPVFFGASGVQTIRVQQREDGISIDQIVLSPSNYLGNSPGSTTNDGVILPEAGGTSDGPPPSGNNEVVIHAQSVTTIAGTWRKESDSTAADGVKLRNPDAGAAKVNTASASPANYFEKSFTADAGKPYHVWLRMKADNNNFANDSVFVQFSGSQTGAGTASWRIGTTSALAVSLQDCNGCVIQGWGWNDNGWASLGAPVYFASGGTQTIRVQTREDGVSIDQIVISSALFLNSSPGTVSNDTTIRPESGTAGEPGPTTGINEIVLHARSAGTIVGAWGKETDASAANGIALRVPDAGAAKVAVASASPDSYFEHEFDADGGKPYHLWVRMKADDDSYYNDSVFVQFSGSENQNGAAAWRIGTTDALSVSLQDRNGATMRGWGWNDNGWASLGDPIYFDDGGPQTIRVQLREDGVSLDQIVLSAGTYLRSSPGALRDDTTILPETANP